MKTTPFHSVTVTPVTNVYHDNTDCPEGKKITSGFKRIGTGNKPKCDKCQKLS